MWKKGDTFADISREVIEVLDEVSIKETHVIGMSLGTIVAQTMADNYPERVKSLILGGAIIRFDIRTNLLLLAGRAVKRFVPYMFFINCLLILLCRVNSMKNHGWHSSMKLKRCTKGIH